jgi:hypothetical protein
MIPTQNVITSASTSSLVSVPGAWSLDVDSGYRDLGDALAELKDPAAQEWQIDESVYNVARHVAGVLMQSDHPPPKIFAHGPKSVVFLWSEGINNLYLTVSANQLSVLTSTPDRIDRRIEMPTEEVLAERILLAALRAAQFNQPILTQKSADKSEAVKTY